MANSDRLSDPSRGTASSGEHVAAIPLVEERVSITKREVESGRVRVHVSVEEREETVTQQVSRDDVEVEHIAKNQRISEMPSVRLEGNTTIVPVVEEMLVVEKVLVLVEEVHIRRRVTSETVEIPVTVKTERARVERQPTDGSTVTAAE
jgi:uncharacterized protein (TIGR02271 family)